FKRETLLLDIGRLDPFLRISALPVVDGYDSSNKISQCCCLGWIGQNILARNKDVQSPVVTSTITDDWWLSKPEILLAQNDRAIDCARGEGGRDFASSELHPFDVGVDVQPRGMKQAAQDHVATCPGRVGNGLAAQLFNRSDRALGLYDQKNVARTTRVGDGSDRSHAVHA